MALNVQNAKALEITEGDVKTIHDHDGKLLWGAVGYDTKYAGDTSQKTYTGKNKLDFTLASVQALNIDGTWSGNTYEYRGISFTVNNDGTIAVSGTATGATRLNLTSSLSLTASTDYILNGSPSGGTTSTYSLRLYTGSSYVSDTGSGHSFTFTDQDVVRVNIGNGTELPSGGLVFKPMIRLATESDSTYEPYVGGSPSPNPDYPQDIKVAKGIQNIALTGGTVTGNYEINLGKNLFQPTGSSGSSNGITYTYNTDGTITVSGEASAQVSFKIGNISLKGGASYVLSGCPVGGGSTTYQLYTNVLTPQFIDYGSGDTHTLTADSSGSVYFVVRSGVDISTPITVKPMFEVGSTPTDFAPYFTPIELCKLGTYQDYIWKDGSNWKIHKAINKILLKGTENWSLGSMFYCTDAVSGKTAVTPATGGAIKSDYFTYSSGATDDPSIDIVNGNILRIKDTSKVDVTALTTWLSNHNTTVYYAFATPTDTQITDTNLIAQLEKLQDFLTRYGYTTSITGDLPIIINQESL